MIQIIIILKLGFKFIKFMNSTTLLNDTLTLAKDRNSVYELLRAYDYIIKQNKIQRNSEIAMNLYTQIIKITTQAKNSNVEDPEIMFSFFKRTGSIKSQARPRNLFEYIQQKDNSEKLNNKTSKNSKDRNIRIVSEFNANEIQKPTNYKQPILPIQKNLIQNVQQQLTDNEKLKQLQITLKKKKINKFLLLLKHFSVNNRKYLKKKSSQYFYISKLKAKLFRSLKSITLVKKKRQNQIKEILDAKDQDTLEEYFLQWKAYTFRTEPERQHQQIIQQKSQLIAKKHFFLRLKTRKHQIQQNSLLHKTQKLHQLIAISRLYVFCQKKTQLKHNAVFLRQQLLKNEAILFYKLLKYFCQSLHKKQNKKITKCQLYLGKKFFKKMSNEFEFNEVYWKKKEKIIFLDMLFNRIRKNFQQQGYFLVAFKKLDEHMLQSPGGKYLRQWKQKKILSALKSYIKNIKDKKNEIYKLHCKKIMKRIKSFYRLQGKIKKIGNKSNILSEILRQKNGQQLLQRLSYKKIQQTKINILNSFLEKRKCQCFLYYIISYKLTKDFYCRKFEQFYHNCQARKLYTYFNGLKYQIKRQKKLRALLSAFINLKEKRTTSTIFKVFKTYSLQEKIHNIKVNNLHKSKFNYSCQFFWKKFKHFHRQCCTQAYTNLQQNKKDLKNTILKKSLRTFKYCVNKNKIQKLINDKIAQQRQLKTKCKIFKILTLNKQYNKEEKKKCQQITNFRNKRLKQQILNKIVNSLTISLYFTSANKLAQKCLLQQAISKLKHF